MNQPTNTIKERIQLFISCRKLKDLDVLSKSDPYAKVYLIQRGQKSLLGQTEVLKNNLNPNFKKTFEFDYFFEVKQELLIEVIDRDTNDKDDLIGSTTVGVGSIVGAKGRTKTIDLLAPNKSKSGLLILKVDKLTASSKWIWWQWSGSKLLNCDWFSKSDPYLQFYRQREGTNEWSLVHQTEVIKNNLNPIWQPFEINIGSLTADQQNVPFKIICYDYDGKNSAPDLIGEALITMNSIILNNQKEFQLVNKKTSKNPGQIQIKQMNLIEKPSFIEYIQGGIQLNLCVAVDFTGSNGTVTNPSSLHYLNPTGAFNQYQQVIQNVGQILLNYDSDQQVPCFGYGATTHYPNLVSKEVNHCFPMNGVQENAEVYGLQGIMQAYLFSLQNVSLSGPTYFGPVIKNAVNYAQILKSGNSEAYLVLLIITDGEIHDMDLTLQLIQQAEQLPMSIIIVGAGNADFSSMKVLDGDDIPASKKVRDLVQFVPYNNFSGNPELLAENVLAELPGQLVKYMQIIGKKPNKPLDIQMSQLQL